MRNFVLCLIGKFFELWILGLEVSSPNLNSRTEPVMSLYWDLAFVFLAFLD